MEWKVKKKRKNNFLRKDKQIYKIEGNNKVIGNKNHFTKWPKNIA
jgi:hypothetical protein